MFRELIVDNFAGGGGASTGIEIAIGRDVDIAINHDPDAIAMHKANHPNTRHYCESVWEVDPYEACGKNKVGLAWFSPDCKHFSKAKGGKPVEKHIRGLAWIVLKWAGKVRPRVIMLENVEEFQTWGPLKKNKPDKKRKGQTFKKWKEQLESLGYVIEHKVLKACDYGAPTIRQRFFLIARCDGKPIVWPKQTHGDPNSLEVQAGLLKPWRTAAEIIDWSIPTKSIFGRKKPLSENTLKRIAKGLEKFVFNDANPFILSIGQTGFSKDRTRSIDSPLNTIVTKAEACVVTPTLIQYHSEVKGGDVRAQGIDTPISTLTTKAGHGLVTANLIQYHTERKNGEVRGQRVDTPIMTIDSAPRYGLVSAFISKNYAGQSRSIASSMNDGVHTITARPCHSLVEVALGINEADNSEKVEEFLEKYYGKPIFGDKGAKEKDNSFLLKYYGNEEGGHSVKEPLGTVTSKAKFGLVTIKGVDYKIVDIGLRMLEPHELFAAQGFPEDYIIDKDFTGRTYPKTKQIARCGNAVPPPFATALVRANLPEICEDNMIEEVI